MGGRKLGSGKGAACPTVDQLVGLGTRNLAEFLIDQAEDNDVLRQRLETLVSRGSAPVSEGRTSRDVDEPHLVGNSRPMLAVFKAIRKFASTDVPILITGESGTGKELAALAIHERSAYRNGPFVPVNCAGIPASLIASELFGHEKGAFTGAHQRHIGRIESAKGGTLFLDEIGDLPADLQSHLLRFLQDRFIERVGGNRAIKIDVRIIAATNQDLERRIAEDRFRADLFFRLNVLRVEMPPLRARGDDVDVLSSYFLKKFSRELNSPQRRFDPSALQAIRQHPWQGNVREMISSIRRGIAMAEDEWITAADLGLAGRGAIAERESFAAVAQGTGGIAGIRAGRKDPRTGNVALGGRRGLNVNEILTALSVHHQNVSRAAKHLGVSRVTLYRHMRKHSIRPEGTH